jgi:hypothetical protein
MAALSALACLNVATASLLGAYPEALHALLAQDRTAVERERALCVGGSCRFDPGLLLRAEEPGWGTGPVPQRLLHFTSNGLTAVSDRPERLKRLIAAGPVLATNGRLQLKGRLFGWIARLICEGVAPPYNAFNDNPPPPRWAHALVGHHLGIATLSSSALQAYRAGQAVNPALAGAVAGNRDITTALDSLRNALRNSPAKLDGNSRCCRLLDAIARSVAAGRLYQSNAEPRQIQRLLLNTPTEYLIERAGV